MHLSEADLNNDAVMIDLETMGTGPLSAIVSIGAVSFSFRRQEIIDRFYSVVDLNSATANGGHIDPDTVMWWLKQSDQARQAISHGQVHVNVALLKFNEWFCKQNDGNSEEVTVWGNGSDFDNVILASTYEMADIEIPWNFRKNRCYRTVINLYPNIRFFTDHFIRIGDHHNALNDAESQAWHLIRLIGAR